MRRTLAALMALASVALAAPAPAQAPPSAFADWSAVVVAGDWRGSGGGSTEAFDNARRDVATALTRAGFRRENLRQFSTRPERYKEPGLEKAEGRAIYTAMQQTAEQAQAGCLFYITSHGTPQGAVLDQGTLPPGILGAMLDRACGKRPTVVVISACFSGVFVPQLAAGHRMVLTAARPDRTSFGCGETDRYPYFDDCFLQSIVKSHDFTALATQTRECVRVREIAENVKPPSEPQVFIGGQLRPMLPLLSFTSTQPGV
jgi:hypothetical protein